jgi:hypothetical protein
MHYVESLLAENEAIVIRTRQHPLVLARTFVLNLLLLLAIVVLAIYASNAQADVAVILSLLVIFPIAVFSRKYLDWWCEEYLVTNRRVIQVEGIFNKHVIDSSLDKVNDVVLDQSLWGRIFDFGDIEILTASEGGVNRLHKIIAPVKFKTKMLDLKEDMAIGEVTGLHPGVADSIPALIADLDGLRKRGIISEAEFDEKKAELLSKI